MLGILRLTFGNFHFDMIGLLLEVVRHIGCKNSPCMSDSNPVQVARLQLPTYRNPADAEKIGQFVYSPNFLIQLNHILSLMTV